MEPATFNPVIFTGNLFLFVAAPVAMVIGGLIACKLLSPVKPNVEKKTAYECGEPTIGSSNIQFDLRFYVVALLFIVFDVEIAFFFPWATVYGKANTLANPALTETQRLEVSKEFAASEAAAPIPADVARRFMLIALVDLLVFFGVLLVGFAYVWKRGDLDWVRSLSREIAIRGRPEATELKAQPAMSA